MSEPGFGGLRDCHDCGIRGMPGVKPIPWALNRRRNSIRNCSHSLLNTCLSSPAAEQDCRGLQTLGKARNFAIRIPHPLP